MLEGADAAAVIEELPEEPVFLGLDGNQAVIAADLSHLQEAQAYQLTGAGTPADVRDVVGGLDHEAACTIAYARGILHWHRSQRFCGTCGGPTDISSSGHSRVCRSCAKELFPRIEPAVITLVVLPGARPHDADRCLLGRQESWEPWRFSTIAGFAEVGESLEDAVRREVLEETGVRVHTVSYQGSQAWPFPASLMVGFRALADSAQIEVDGSELVEARWCTADELRRRVVGSPQGGQFRVDSISRVLIETWMAEQP